MIRRAIVGAALVALVSVAVPLWGASAQRPILAGRVHESFQPNNGKIFVLVIGNDARQGNPSNALADAVHLVGINTNKMRAGILNFPRDSWVNIPGYGSAKLNEGTFAGGPPALANTLEHVTGIRIDYWVMTGFEGFDGIMRGIGNIPYKFDRDVYDYGSGARIKAGTKRLTPRTALAYVRSRKAFSGGDVDRTTNQGSVLRAMLGKLRLDVKKNPAELIKWIALTEKHASFDISPDELFRLGVLATQMKPADVSNVTVPVSLGHVGAASVVFIDGSAQTLYKRFRRNGYL